MWLLLLLSAAGGLAHASGQDLGNAHFEQGAALFKADRYAEALVEFQASYEANRYPRLLYYLGKICLKLGRPEEALRHFQDYLSAEPDLQPAHRAAVEGFMAEARKELAGREAAQVQAPRAVAPEAARSSVPVLVRAWSPANVEFAPQ